MSLWERLWERAKNIFIKVFYRMKIKKCYDLLENARSLRKSMTKQEKRLWYDFLKLYPIKIYKQRIIEHYIADFYCHKARLVIEIDGAQHYTPDGKSYDQARTDIMEKYDLQVLRFPNKDIDEKFEGVCYIIDKTIKERICELGGERLC